ncbi:hypothetical protein WKH56_06260 [Priestia sp. SB1]|uniref:hypothetical protein n=1 Tax=Priestia sp. SB1 TaxID=3132359 RepID=UPI0031749E5D
MELALLIVGGILTGGAYMWYYATLGKKITEEEKAAGRDLTYEINPFTGSAKDVKEESITNYKINSRDLY